VAPSMPASFRPTDATLDTALRYYAVLELLRDRWRADARVLEVGSGSGGVTEWLDHAVVGVDSAFERTAERGTARLEQRVGRANALPVESESFDFVLSLELLEHMPEDERSMALQEMVRALAPGGRMVVTFPADAAAERLDRWLNRSFHAVTGEEHPWVSEHLAAGLPRSEEIRAEAAVVAGPGADVQLRRHFAPGAFRLVHGLYGVRRWYRFSRPLGLHSEVAVGALFRLLRGREPRGEAYRAILVVDKPATAR
jgi:SAM-dependent methyltransferase